VDDVLADESDSQLLKLGWAALKRINSQDPAEQQPPSRRIMLDPLVSPDPKHPFQLLVSLILQQKEKITILWVQRTTMKNLVY